MNFKGLDSVLSCVMSCPVHVHAGSTRTYVVDEHDKNYGRSYTAQLILGFNFVYPRWPLPKKVAESTAESSRTSYFK